MAQYWAVKFGCLVVAWAPHLDPLPSTQISDFCCQQSRAGWRGSPGREAAGSMCPCIKKVGNYCSRPSTTLLHSQAIVNQRNLQNFQFIFSYITTRNNIHNIKNTMSHARNESKGEESTVNALQLQCASYWLIYAQKRLWKGPCPMLRKAKPSAVLTNLTWEKNPS